MAYVPTFIQIACVLTFSVGGDKLVPTTELTFTTRYLRFWIWFLSCSLCEYVCLCLLTSPYVCCQSKSKTWQENCWHVDSMSGMIISAGSIAMASASALGKKLFHHWRHGMWWTICQSCHSSSSTIKVVICNFAHMISNLEDQTILFELTNAKPQLLFFFLFGLSISLEERLYPRKNPVQ